MDSIFARGLPAVDAAAAEAMSAACAAPSPPGMLSNCAMASCDEAACVNDAICAVCKYSVKAARLSADISPPFPAANVDEDEEDAIAPSPTGDLSTLGLFFAANSAR